MKIVICSVIRTLFLIVGTSLSGLGILFNELRVGLFGILLWLFSLEWFINISHKVIFEEIMEKNK